jgi:2'-5' RNA ligase
MPRRTFISIALPSQITRHIAGHLEALRGDQNYEPIFQNGRMMPSDQWHITLSFLGDQEDNSIANIVNTLKKVNEAIDVPEIAFENISYGPPGKNPRMLWLTTTKETSRELGAIKLMIEDALDEIGIRYDREYRDFHGHITLVRFSRSDIPLPSIALPIRLAFSPKGFSLMESHLARSGAEYDILQEFMFAQG